MQHSFFASSSITLVFVLGGLAGCGGKTRDSGQTSSAQGGADSTSATANDAVGCVEPLPTPPPIIDGGAAQPPVPWIPESRYGTTLAVPLDCYESNARKDCGLATSQQRNSRVTATIRIEERDGVAHFQIDALPSQGVGPGMSAEDAVFDGKGRAEAGRAETIAGTDVSQIHAVQLLGGRLNLFALSQTTENAPCGGVYARKTQCEGSIPWDGYTPPSTCP